MSHLSSIILLSLLVVATAANPILQSHDDWLYPSGSNDISNADILATTTLHDISEHSANQEADLSLSKISEVLYDTNTLPDDLHNSARTAIIISTNDLGCSTGVEISKTEAKPDAFCRNDRVQLKDPDCDAIDGEGRSPYCCEGGHKEYAEVRKRCMDCMSNQSTGERFSFQSSRGYSNLSVQQN